MSQRLSLKTLALLAVCLLATPSASAAAPNFCAPLKSVIASGDFRSIQKGEARTQDSARWWVSSIEIPGSSVNAQVRETSGERVFVTEFGTWQNLPVFDQPSLPDQKEMDARFKALAADLLTCLPDWSREKTGGGWELVLKQPPLTLDLAVMHNDEEHWIQLRIARKATVQEMLGLPKSAPASAAKPVPLDPVLLDEDFRDNRRKWLEGSTAEFIAKIENGSYSIDKKATGGTLLTWIGVNVDRERDYTVRADFKIESGGDAGVGLVWAAAGRSNINALYVTQGGAVTYGETVNSVWSESSRWSEAGKYNSNVSCPSCYAIEIKRHGRLVDLSVNGKLAGTALLLPKGGLFGFAINGVAHISVQRISINQP